MPPFHCKITMHVRSILVETWFLLMVIVCGAGSRMFFEERRIGSFRQPRIQTTTRTLRIRVLQHTVSVGYGSMRQVKFGSDSLQNMMWDEISELISCTIIFVAGKSKGSENPWTDQGKTIMSRIERVQHWPAGSQTWLLDFYKRRKDSLTEERSSSRQHCFWLLDLCIISLNTDPKFSVQN